jgi:hypothetical protein
MVVTKKTEAILKAIVIYLALNAFVYGAIYIVLWLARSPAGQWLEVNKSVKPYSPAYWFLLQFGMLLSAYSYYRYKMKQD